MASRWRREDYDKVRHDKRFSDWKVLVGPCDWQLSGREGGERFRSRNLPGLQAGSGVYELGVTLPAWKTVDHYSESASLKSEDIVVVYVGHAEHIRKRLQRYGQAGAYLESPRSPPTPPGLNLDDPALSEEHLCKSERTRRGMQVRIPESRIPVADPVSPELRSSSKPQSPRGPRLFSEVFALGCSIAYRWASTRTKEVAEYVVQDLTEVFDYAWNRGGNSHVRSQDILGKIVLGKRAPEASCCTRTSAFPWTRKPVIGVRIEAHRPRMRRDSAPRRLFRLLRRSPHLMIIGGRSAKHSEFTKTNIPVDRCGALLPSGLVCNGLKQKGRTHCPAHMASEPSSCLPFRFPKTPKLKEPKRKGSVSFSTWLTRSVEVKHKSIEWLLAMEEIKGRTYNHASSSPILKPEIVSPETLSAEIPPRLSLSNNGTEETPRVYYPKVDRGMPCSIVSRGSPGPDWSHTYGAPQYFQG